MNRLLFSIVVIVVLSVLDQGLGADTHSARSPMSSSNGQAAEKRRNKRQVFSPLPSSMARVSDAYGSAYGNTFSYVNQNSDAIQTSIQSLTQKSLYVGGVVPDLNAFRRGQMCVGDSNLLSANGLTAACYSHITPIQLSLMNMYPCRPISLDLLLNAGYIQSYGQSTLLTALGILACHTGHLRLDQLQPLGITSLSTSAFSFDSLTQANYMTSQCIPTGLGLAALHLQYVPSTIFSSFNNCPSLDADPISMLRSANYFHGNLLRSVAFAAIRSGWLTVDRCRSWGLFPYGARLQTSATYYQSQTLTITDIVQAGYAQTSNCLFNQAGLDAIDYGYFSTDHLSAIGAWPLRASVGISAFISAGYVNYAGHLTTLGCNLYRARYFSSSLLVQMGIHQNDAGFFHHILHMGEFFQSEYHVAHSFETTSVSTSALASAASVKTSEYVAGSNIYNSNGIVNNLPIMRK